MRRIKRLLAVGLTAAALLTLALAEDLPQEGGPEIAEPTEEPTEAPTEAPEIEEARPEETAVPEVPAEEALPIFRAVFAELLFFSLYFPME